MRALCKSSLHSLPSLASTQFRFKYFRTPSSSSSPTTFRVFRMACQASPNGDAASSAIDFLTLCHRLKVFNLGKYFFQFSSIVFFSFLKVVCFDCYQTTKRAGWVKRDVQNPESIADHMYRMGLMALISSDIPGVDRDKLFIYFFSFCYCLNYLFQFFLTPRNCN